MHHTSLYILHHTLYIIHYAAHMNAQQSHTKHLGKHHFPQSDGTRQLACLLQGKEKGVQAGEEECERKTGVKRGPEDDMVGSEETGARVSHNFFTDRQQEEAKVVDGVQVHHPSVLPSYCPQNEPASPPLFSRISTSILDILIYLDPIPSLPCIPSMPPAVTSSTQSPPVHSPSSSSSFSGYTNTEEG